MYNALREADADFDVVDFNGDTPLHLAAQCGATIYARQLLHGGAFPSTQNNLGNQPCHLAATYDHIDILKDIAIYDRHIGRINYGHMTCLGAAKFHNASQSREFLEKHFRLTHIVNGRNELGDIWWDKHIDEQAGLWEVVMHANGLRTYRHSITGEVSDLPPAVSVSTVLEVAKGVEVPRVAAVVAIREADPITKHAYLKEKKLLDADVQDMTKDYRNATIINKYARRKLAYLALIRNRLELKRNKIIARFLRKYMPNVQRWKKLMRHTATARIQSRWRGVMLRSRFFAKPNGMFWMLRIRRAKRVLRYKLWAMWRSYLSYLTFSQLSSAASSNLKTLADWQIVLDKVRRPLRVVGMYEVRS
jgi:hypothetical protein